MTVWLVETIVKEIKKLTLLMKVEKKQWKLIISHWPIGRSTFKKNQKKHQAVKMKIRNHFSIG